MSKRERWQDLESWFHRLDELGEPERSRELERLARESPDLHASLVPLFADGGAVAQIEALEDLAQESRARLSTAPPPLPERIGPYRVIRILGRGGMGTVYEAEQVEHVHRRVALKLMRADFDSERVVARFHRERQSLAVMDHPSIARVLDAGTTDTGRPFFVMELVDGESITDWANRKGLSLEERVELFIPVCKAVQHAHTKGVIHRDLKPSNILVTEHEGKALPKVIDFGIAKAIEQPVAARTLATRLGEIVGTPAYMSPEQATFGKVDVDTRSDVYGLGVVLYELLVGELPLPASEMGALLFDEICRRIREDETPRPSARISRIGVVPGGAGPLQSWTRRLRGDLDQVVLKAMAKARDHRYDSAGDFAADLERFLADLPVLAAPPSLRYRASKLVRRHRAAVAILSVATLMVLAGLTAAGLSWLDARRSEVEARTALRTAERTTDFLVDLFRGVAPEDSPGIEVGARELLDRGAAALELSFEEEPKVKAALLQALGRVYGNLPIYGRSEEYLRRALELRRSLGADPLDIAASEAALGQVLGVREQFVEAEALLRSALATRRRLLGEHPETAAALEELATVVADRGEVDEPLTLLEEALGMRRHLGDDLALAESMSRLGALHQMRHERDRAIELLEQALELERAQLGNRSLDVSESLMDLATALVHRGNWERSEALFREAVDIRRELAGEESHDYAWSVSMLAWCLRRQGKLEEAERLMRQGLELQRKLLGNEHSQVGQILGNLGRIVDARDGDPAEVEALYQESFEVLERTSGPNHESTAEALTRLSRLRLAQGRLEEAEQLARDVLRRLAAPPVSVGTSVWYKTVLLGDVLTARGRYSEAEKLMLPSYEKILEEEGAAAPSTQSAARMLTRLYEAAGRPKEAKRYADEKPAP